MLARINAFVLSTCLIGSGSSAFATEQPKLQSAKVVSQNFGNDYAGTDKQSLGGGVMDVPITQSSNILVIETAKQLMTLSETAGKPFVVPTVNGNLEYYVDGKRIVILDAKGKKHKFAIIRVEDIAPDK